MRAIPSPLKFPRFRLISALVACLAASATFAFAEPTAVFTHFRYSGRQPSHQGLKVGGLQYLNPVIEGSYSDPTVVRVGRDYYLANATFTLFPGSGVFHSRDLVHWKQIGAAIARPSQVDYAGLDTWQGNYADDLKYKDGVFYLTSACQGCGGPFVMTARDPAGPWSEPTWLPIDGIDTSIFFDDDGRGYILITGPPPGGAKWQGHRAIWLQEIDLRTLKLKGERTVLVDGGDDPSGKPYWLEGPHLLKRDGRHLLICAQGGTKEHHTEVAFRADRLTGPYTPSPFNPILAQNGLDPSRPAPVVQAGHADLVETPAGDTWAVFLASRPWSGDELTYSTGRETFLLPVTWRDGWPIILPHGETVPLIDTRPKLPNAPTGEPHGGDFNFQDDFRTPRLSPAWAMLQTPRSTWWRAGDGALRLAARGEALGGTGQPSLLVIRQQHMDATAEITLTRRPEGPGTQAGLTAYQGRRRFFAIAVATRRDGACEVRLERMAGDADAPDGAVTATAATPCRGAIRLRVAAEGRWYRFSYAAAGQAWRKLGDPQDGALLSTRGSGGFTGVLLGPFSSRISTD